MLITGTEKTDVGNREARPVIWVRVVARVTRALRAPGTCLLYTSDAADDWLVV